MRLLNNNPQILFLLVSLFIVVSRQTALMPNIGNIGNIGAVNLYPRTTRRLP